MGEPFADPWVLSVVAKLIGDEATYTSGNGSINEKLLERDIAAWYCADDYIFVFEGASQGDKIERGSDVRESMRIGGYCESVNRLSSVSSIGCSFRHGWGA